MIPKQVIEKAIDGGWRLDTPNISYEMDDGWVMHETDGVKEAILRYEQIALDPSFWQALGKALGWYTWYDQPTEGTRWFIIAHRFYDLILTGGSTDEFWENVLK